MDQLQEISEKKEKWYEANVTNSRFKPRDVKSSWGEELDVVYTPDNLAGIDYLNDIGLPGEFPFVRGVQPTMYRGRLWTMRQYAGIGNPEETNVLYKELLSKGQTGLSVAFDLPSQIGYDSDDPTVEEEVGRVGVAVDSLKDIEIIFEGIPLDKITTSFTVNPTSAVILAMYVALAQKRNISLDKIGGTLQNDILKEYLARGTYIYPPTPSMRLIGDIIEYCRTEVPKMNTISICGYHMREAGCSMVQEVAYCLSDAIAYVEEVLKRGIDVDEFAPRLSFLMCSGMRMFEEVAKFRAMRKLWAKIMKNRFNAKNPKSMKLRMFTGCSASSFTDKEPLNNIARGAIMSLVASLSGCQAIHCTAYDEAYAIPTEQSQRIALRTQQIIGYETDIAAVADPMGGSYFLEAMTDKIEKEVEKEMAKIEEYGGMVKGISDGSIPRDIARQSYEEAKKIESGESVLVGVNKFVSDEDEADIDITLADTTIRDRQVVRLEETKKNRNNKQVEMLLDEIKRVAETSGNLMGPILLAVHEYATLGEICGALRDVFGEYQEIF
ncbi:methylmalonyl-CoA mutase, N-terminal domain [Desulfosarcina sp. BuS5]|uniref:acyl-CoA mutase large subunit family protein n=1 Tax=Desulfosarcina sp. BuS5 TaxID=933262 RepID=UPI000485CDA9|nr:methylmalonyl-CoA mutase family protein [Desulfosarcina sp. BuS5]WDN90152.1 methylmalonyl-CoA mutase, N-terminal domain [Desulfosarcina sp. BuS5]